MSERIISIKVRDRIAVTESDEPYICGNTDYVVQFDFDEEWDAYDAKTARFTHDGMFQDVVFSGNSCPVPAITNAYEFYVGVYAGDLWVTTAARVLSKKSVLCENAAPEKPPESVYNKIMEMLNEQSKNSVKTWSDLGETTVIAPISWDGDTEGRESVIHEHVTSDGEITTNTYYKVSDTPLTKEELTDCELAIILVDYDTGFRDTITENQIETIDLSGADALLGDLGVLSVSEGHPTVSAGLYFASMSFVGAKVRMVLYKVQINTIPKEYLGGLAEVAFSGSYNDLTDKPSIPDAVTDDHINSLLDAAPHVKTVNNEVPDENGNVEVTYDGLTDAPCGVRTIEEVLNGLENIKVTMGSVSSGSGTSVHVRIPYAYKGDLEGIEVGRKYKVVLNGEETVVEAKRTDCIGNRKINVPTSTSDDNPEANFYLETSNLTNSSLKRATLFLPSDRKGENVTISVYKCTEEVTKLPLKLVPDEVQLVGEPLYLFDPDGVKYRVSVETDGTLIATKVIE